MKTKQSIRLLALAFLSTTIILAACNKEKWAVNGDPGKFTYLAEEDPPFNYSSNATVAGVSVEVLDSLFIRIGATVDHTAVTVSDYQTAYDKVLSTPEYMLLSVAKTTDNEDLFKWVGPIATDNEVVVALANSGYSLTDATGLNNYFTGVVDEFGNVDKLLSHGVLRANIQIYPNRQELYRALVVNREVQFIFMNDAEHLKTLQELGYQRSQFAVPFGIHSEARYYAFNIETADDLISRFQQQLVLLKSAKTGDGSNVYDQILNRYHL